MSAILTPTAFGPMLVPPFDAYLAQALIRMGVYAPEEFATWRPYLPEGGCVVDAGANIGAHTMAFAHAVGLSGSVIAIEPQRMLHHMLCGSIALNGLLNIQAKHIALGRERSTVRIPRLDYAAPNNFGGLEIRGHADGELVGVVPLDEWKLPRLDFMKVDVEGMELEVLNGASETIKAHRPVLCIEADRPDNVEATLALLGLWDYCVWWHRPPLGPIWPNVVSINLMALPRERRLRLHDPQGHVEVAIA